VLSDDVLTELARKTPSQQHLVALAWPSLTTSEHLQLIAAVQSQHGKMNGTPDWLIDLALTSPAPIVRYQALRHGYLFKNSEADKARAAKVAAEPSDVVRGALERFHMGGVTPEQLTDLPHVERILAIRHWDYPVFEDFIDWLVTAHKTLPTSEVMDAIAEFFANPAVVEELSPTKFTHSDDGYSEYRLGEGMSKGWELCRTADNALATLLASHLPVNIGLREMKVEDLADMPSHVLSLLTYRSDDPLFEELATHIVSSPEKFDESLRKNTKEARLDIRRYRRFKGDAAAEQAEQRAEERERQRDLADGVARLRESVYAIQEQLQAVQIALSKRRGFFG
jgi:hypothetical protein